MAPPKEDRELMGGRGGGGRATARTKYGPRAKKVPIAQRHEATALKEQQLRQANLPGLDATGKATSPQ